MKGVPARSLPLASDKDVPIATRSGQLLSVPLIRRRRRDDPEHGAYIVGRGAAVYAIRERVQKAFDMERYCTKAQMRPQMFHHLDHRHERSARARVLCRD